MELKKYKISKIEYNGLLFSYYNALFGLHNSKGIAYKNCFKVVQNIKKIGNENRNKNINDFIEVENDEDS